MARERRAQPGTKPATRKTPCRALMTVFEKCLAQPLRANMLKSFLYAVPTVELRSLWWVDTCMGSSCWCRSMPVIGDDSEKHSSHKKGHRPESAPRPARQLSACRSAKAPSSRESTPVEGAKRKPVGLCGSNRTSAHVAGENHSQGVRLHILCRWPATPDWGDGSLRMFRSQPGPELERQPSPSQSTVLSDHHQRACPKIERNGCQEDSPLALNGLSIAS